MISFDFPGKRLGIRVCYHGVVTEYFLDQVFYNTRIRFSESEFGAVVIGEVFGSSIDGLGSQSSIFKELPVLDMEYGYFGVDLPDLGEEFELF